MDEETMRDLLYYYDQVGDHGHGILFTAGTTASDGPHSHIWLVESDLESPVGTLYAGRLLDSDWDGAHLHGLDPANARTDKSGAHAHGVYARGMTMATEFGGEHDHELSIRRTASSGVHGHDLKIGGTTLKSLMPKDFFRMMAESLVDEKSIDLNIAMQNGTFVVKNGDKPLSRHTTEKGAVLATVTHEMLLRCGLSMGDEIGGLGWMALATRRIAMEQKVHMNSKFLSSLERLAGE